MGSGYSITIDKDYELLSQPEVKNGSPILYKHGKAIVAAVEGYTVLADIVVGEASEGFFLASREGEIMIWQSKEDWSAYIRREYPGFSGNMLHPGVMQSDQSAWLLGAVAFLIMWALLGVLVSIRRERGT
ncbi:MAG: hypothetical protein AMXMBFR13_47000 [Phycisphaerae bacterium]